MMSIQLHSSVVIPRRLIGIGAALLMAVVLTLALIPRTAEVTVRISIPDRTRSAPFYVAMDKGFFRNEGVHVEVTVPITGKDGMQMVTAGRLDLAAVDMMPVIEAILNGQHLWILTSVSHTDRHVGLVVPATIDRFEQLQGKRVAVTPGTTSELFVRTMLLSVGLTSTDVVWIDLQPDEMPHALTSGDVDGASNVAPFLTQTAAALPGARILYADGNYFDYFLLVASPELVRAKPETVRKVLSALVKATHYIHQHGDESQNIVGRHFATPPHDWDMYDFNVYLDSFLARILTAHAAVAQGGRKDLPDFERSFYYQGLPSGLRAAVISTLWEDSTE